MCVCVCGEGGGVARLSPLSLAERVWLWGGGWGAVCICVYMYMCSSLVDRALLGLENTVMWVQIPPGAAHFPSRSESSQVLLYCPALS